MSSFSFSRVVIIESLDPNDFKSGTSLCEYINGLKENDPNSAPAELTEVEDCKGFLEKIRGLTLSAQNEGDFPILHIEVHGCGNKTGIAFQDGSSLSWNDLADELTLLNKAMRFNLIVCVSACFGGYFLEGIRPMAPAPCFALIGPTDTAKADELLGSFRNFYKELLKKLDARAALEALLAHRLEHGGYVTVTAEDWFFKLMNGVLQGDCTPSRIKERADKIIETMVQQGKEVSPSDRITIEEKGKGLALDLLDRTFPTFFMIDSIPENSLRFADSLARAKAKAEIFFDTHWPIAAVSPTRE